MPSTNYYCADNFFKKMTDLDSPKRNNDCYFYYYSTCAKGDSCTFRHEPSALGCETMCSFWKEGKCLNVHCNFRHMELRKNRKAIQCYWETQPGGCLKPHCPFLHQSVKPSEAYSDNKIGSNTEPAQTIKSDIGQASDKGFKNPVDTLVVKFEEESDTESAISLSPIKNHNKRVKVKTLEEIKLEKMQEESAAYFSYDGNRHASASIEDDLRSRLLLKMRQKKQVQDDNQEHPMKRIKLTISENVAPDDRIKNVTTRVEAVIDQPKNPENFSLDEHIHQKRKRKIGTIMKKDDKDSGSFKIKTLAEIRAERMRKQEELDLNKKKRNSTNESENEVSSTSRDEMETVQEKQPRKKLKLRRLSSEKFEEKNTNSNTDVNLSLQESGENKESSPNDRVLDSKISVFIHENGPKTEMNIEENSIDSQSQDETNSEDDPFRNKLTEEVLLLDDDDDFSNVTLKAEDELLGEIDDILGS